MDINKPVVISMILMEILKGNSTGQLLRPVSGSTVTHTDRDRPSVTVSKMFLNPTTAPEKRNLF